MVDEETVDVPKRTKQVIVIRRDLKMRRGKEVAQGSHASMQFLLQGSRMYNGAPRYTEAEQVWLGNSFAKVCVRCNSDEELVAIHEKAVDAGLKSYIITDSGRTEFGGVPTRTCIAIGPDFVEKFEGITDGLELM